MFDGIAPRYDLLNRMMSFGIDRRWRKRTVRALDLRPGDRVLDLATGTADLAMSIARTDSTVTVVGVDPSDAMLEVGQRKLRKTRLDERVELRAGIAEELPFEDDSVDATCIAFGIRNVLDRPRALEEMARVTRPGGVIAILELSEPRSGILGPLARFHVHHVVPTMGALLSGRREYRYLQRSIQAFPPPEAFCQLMAEAGLDAVSAMPLTFGVAQLFTGRVRA
jgi:demethylmenaquinone methyltransferase/2-methoxy-6-polyprenyl-1,4-benzoquinol methylase